MSEVQEAGEGRYLYCIINGGVEFNFGRIGIEDAEVYTIPYKDAAVVVHSCQAKPYVSKDEEKVKRWIFTHNYVIDKATELFGTVLPFSFDVIIKGDESTVKDWLSRNYGKFKEGLEKVKDKAEYTVQIFCDQDRLAEKILSEDEELSDEER